MILERKKKRQSFFEKEFLDYLLYLMVITPEELNVLQKQLESGRNMDHLLKVLLPGEEMLRHKSDFLGIRRVCLNKIHLTEPLVIPEEIARKYSLFPCGIEDGRLLVAMADPTDRKALDDVKLYSRYPVEPLLAGTEEIKVAIREAYTVKKSALENSTEARANINSWKVDEDSEYIQDAPVIRLVDSLLRQAVAENASDIHWEPREKIFQVKFRIDGLLEVKTTFPIGIANSVAARLKVMAGMDVTEKRIPQDGRIVLDLPDKRIDLRVSTLPTVYGEKIVTRILDEETASRTLAQLGMRSEVEEGVRRLLRQPYGLILISGPTGSGKTTTLYALLRELQGDTRNIVSIEDPVEYRLPGVNQSQVNPKMGLDFAGGLRAILRQDPDIIMVGEIRDKETAQMATAAALTGHLVLSTLHTNTAAEALARMLDMDIEPYLIAASVCGVLAQRLVRKLCPYCKAEHPIPQELKQGFPWKGARTLYRSTGCIHCRGTGYLGRIGVHEFLPYNQEIKELVLQKSSSVLLEKASRAAGMIDLREDALNKVIDGQTSWEEVMRLSAGF